MPIVRKIRRGGEKSATAEDVRVIVGPLEDAIIEAIVHIGATPREVLHALQLLEENHYTKAIYSRPMEDHVRRVYDILDYERSILNTRKDKH